MRNGIYQQFMQDKIKLSQQELPLKIGSLALPATNSYNWTSVPVGYSSTLKNPSVTPNITTTYTMQATGTNGCTRTHSVVITVK